MASSRSDSILMSRLCNGMMGSSKSSEDWMEDGVEQWSARWLGMLLLCVRELGVVLPRSLSKLGDSMISGLNGLVSRDIFLFSTSRV